MDEQQGSPKSFSRRKLLAGLGLVGAAAFAGAFANHIPKVTETIVNKILGKKNLIRIGFEGVVYAIAPDITVDGTDDHVQVQQALDALPAAGGKIILYGGDYDFGATVSRAIDNVVIEGSGKATYLANNASDNLITAGAQTGWIIKDLRTDAGGLGGTFGTAATNLRKNVWINTTYYNDSPTHLPLAGGTMTGAIVMGANGIDLTQALSTDHTWSGPILSSQQEGETLAFGNLVHQKITDGKWYKMDKDAEADAMGSVGIVVVRSGAGAGQLTVAMPGCYIRDDSWAFDCTLFETAQYVGDAGALADQAAAEAFGSADCMRCVGHAYIFDTTKYVLHLNPSPDWLEVA